MLLASALFVGDFASIAGILEFLQSFSKVLLSWTSPIIIYLQVFYLKGQLFAGIFGVSSVIFKSFTFVDFNCHTSFTNVLFLMLLTFTLFAADFASIAGIFGFSPIIFKSLTFMDSNCHNLFTSVLLLMLVVSTKFIGNFPFIAGISGVSGVIFIKFHFCGLEHVIPLLQVLYFNMLLTSTLFVGDFASIADQIWSFFSHVT